jgi:IS605 OrfB family transposase
MRIRTIALTLNPTVEQQTMLEQLQRQWSAACDYISRQAWAAREFNTVRLQRLVYRAVRDQFGLLAQHTIRAIAVVCDSYKAERTHLHTWRAGAAVVLDTPRLYSVKENRASTATLAGRQSIQLRIGGHQRHQLRLATKLAEADLIRDEKGRWRLLVSAHFGDPVQTAPADVLGVDLGIVSIATDSDGDTYSGAALLALRARYAHLRTKLQKKGTASARKLRRKRARREHRMQRAVNHVISKRIVAKAQAHGQAIALEDLTHLRSRTRVRWGQRRVHHSWAYADLRAKIAYKAQAAGVRVILVDPRNTSRTCRHCGLVDKASRRSQALFLCTGCGASAHADVNAALVIRERGRAAVMQPDIPGVSDHQVGQAGTSPLL